VIQGKGKVQAFFGDVTRGEQRSGVIDENVNARFGCGKTIVYEQDFGIWKLDTKTGKSTPIKINIVSDDKENATETITVRNDADSYDLSPSSKRAAVSVHDGIFSIATDRVDIQRVTQSFSREADPSWSPDGKWVAFVSDKSGMDEVWMAHEDGTGLKKLSEGDGEKQAIQWARRIPSC